MGVASVGRRKTDSRRSDKRFGMCMSIVNGIVAEVEVWYHECSNGENSCPRILMHIGLVASSIRLASPPSSDDATARSDTREPSADRRNKRQPYCIAPVDCRNTLTLLVESRLGDSDKDDVDDEDESGEDGCDDACDCRQEVPDPCVMEDDGENGEEEREERDAAGDRV